MLTKAGLVVLYRNWRRRSGEIDIVAMHGEVLVIIEVRVRNHAGFGSAADSVTHAKQRRIVRTTQQLLQQQPQLARLRLRFDVIEARPNGSAFELNWIRHAFDAG